MLCRNKRIYAAHLGDTRIYNFKNNNKTYITADHSIAFEEMIKNHGSPDDIRTNPNRHILNAALGVDYSQHPVTFKHRIKNNLSFLICSDGFWEYVLEDEMLLALVNTQTAREWLEKMLEFHRKKTDTSNDNYSAICLKITKK